MKRKIQRNVWRLLDTGRPSCVLYSQSAKRLHLSSFSFCRSHIAPLFVFPFSVFLQVAILSSNRRLVVAKRSLTLYPSSIPWWRATQRSTAWRVLTPSSSCPRESWCFKDSKLLTNYAPDALGSSPDNLWAERRKNRKRPDCGKVELKFLMDESKQCPFKQLESPENEKQLRPARPLQRIREWRKSASNG